MIAAAVERCAGIDVGKQILAVTVMIGPLEGEPRVEQRMFGTNVQDLEQLREWLVKEAVTHCVMESTGSYWKPVFNVLESSVKVYLANGEEVKNRKGHKTDRKDGWWLAHLLRHAMIHPSFIPPVAVRELRDLTRRRKKVLGDGVAEKNRVQKILEDANVKLGNVLSDVFGTSGQLMLEALLEGGKNPGEIAELAKRRARNRIPEITATLEGHRMSDHHRRMIRFSLDHMKFLDEQMERLDEAIAAQIEKAGLKEEWKLLQTVPGVQEKSAANILAETGGDMATFPTSRKLSSWAGVCPGNYESAGTRKHASTNRGNPWLKSTLTECAWAAAAKKNCFIKDEFWRIAAKHGGKKAPAVIAVGHTLIRIVHRVLSTKLPFQETKNDLQPAKKEKLIRHHVRRLGTLGVRVHHSVLRRTATQNPSPEA